MQHYINKSIWFRRIRFAVTCCVLMFFYVIKITYENYIEIEPIIIKRDNKMVAITEDISCYYTDNGNFFLSTEDPSFTPPPKDKSIFFIESACKEEMSMLQACVIESAAMAHPESKIYVLFSYSITQSQIKGYFGQVLNYPNVFAARIHIAQYAKGTALESILVNDINKTRHPIEDITDILKIVTLHKWGGTVLSTDMMVMRSFEDLPKNWIAKKNNEASSRVLSFAKDDVGTNITNEIMKEFAKTYDTKSRYVNRLKTTLIQVLKRRCPDIFTSKSGECNGFKVFSEDFFFPIQIPSPAPYVDEGTESGEVKMPYTFHLKNLDFSSYPSEEWPSENLARIFCPNIFEFKLKIS